MTGGSYIQPVIFSCVRGNHNVRSQAVIGTVLSRDGWTIVTDYESIINNMTLYEKAKTKPFKEDEDVIAYSMFLGEYKVRSAEQGLYKQYGFSLFKFPNARSLGFSLSTIGTTSPLKVGDEFTCAVSTIDACKPNYDESSRMFRFNHPPIITTKGMKVKIKSLPCEKGNDQRTLYGIESDVPKEIIPVGSSLYDSNNRLIGVCVKSSRGPLAGSPNAVFVSFYDIIKSLAVKTCLFQPNVTPEKKTVLGSLLSVPKKSKVADHYGIVCYKCGNTKGKTYWVCPRCGGVWSTAGRNCADCGVAMVSETFCDNLQCSNFGKPMKFNTPKHLED